MNKSLKHLDLRNNQISHATTHELSGAIEKNKVLRSLDLRWNNIGLVGGKSLLNALRKNHTLINLQIAGNNVPEEIGDSINNKIAHNSEQVRVAKDYSTRTATLSNQLESVRFQKEKQVNVLLSKIDHQEESVRKTSRAMSEKMRKLQSALEDRMSTVSSLTSKLSLAEGDLALAEQKSVELQHSLQKMQLDKENEISLLQSQLKRIKDDAHADRLKKERDCTEAEHRCSQMDDALKEASRKNQELQMTTYDAKEKLAQGQAEYQIKMAVLDDESRRLKQKQRDELKEFEANKSKEIERLKDDFELVEKNLKERINKLEAVKHSNEDELSRMKSSQANDKLYHEQEMHELKLKAQLEDSQRRKELEDRTRHLQSSRDELAAEAAQTNAKVVDLQQKMSSQTLEIETLKRNNDTLRQQCADKDIEMLSGVEKVRTDYEKRVRTIQKDIDRCEEYKSGCTDLEIKLKKMEADYDIQLKSTQMDKDQLKMKVKTLEECLNKYRDEDDSRNRKAQSLMNEMFKPSQALNQQS